MFNSNSSPCIDAGDNNAVSESTDIIGNDRIFNNRTVDIGAYEFCTYDIIYVDKDATSGKDNGTTWFNAFTNLQGAIGIAVSGNEIWVAQGTYVLSSGLSVDEEISIYGGFNGTETQRSQRNWETNTTTVDGDNIENISCFFIWDKCTTIDGFTITNAGADYFDPGTGISCTGGSTTITNCNITNNGLGISCSSSSSPTINNCTFSGNGDIYSGSYAGGGIGIGGSSSPTITNCVFSQNIAGGIGISSSSSSTISDCVFNGNSSGDGAGISISGSSPTITDCLFSGNSADGYGGGINIVSATSTSSPTIKDCVFSGNNVVNNSGGAIACLSYSTASSPTIDSCVFYDNTADDDGGGFYSFKSAPNLINCLFIDNEADNGGGIATISSNGSTVINCTFYANASLGTRDSGGGAVYATTMGIVHPRCYTTLINCILWDNTAADAGHEVCCTNGSSGSVVVVTLKYSDIQDTDNWKYEEGDYDAVNYEPYSIYHNIYDNPTFVNPGSPKGGDDEWATSDDGFMIQITSECKDNGDDVTGSPHNISDDITGNDRKIGSDVDIGAYEYDPN